MCRSEEQIKENHPEMGRGAEDSTSTRIKKRKKNTSRSLKLDWIGALEDIADQYSSVELQHKILDSWDEEQDELGINQ
jgi:hypothetical protein